VKIEKTKNLVNTYKCELSYGQLIAMRNGLAMQHADPVADEMHYELSVYLDMLPRPGEEKGKNGEIVPQGRGEQEGPNAGTLGQGRIEDIDLDKELPSPEEAEGPKDKTLEEPEAEEGETAFAESE
jgi:hypothetical protein